MPNPTVGAAIIMILMPRDEMPINSSLSVNIMAMYSGSNSQIRNEIDITIVEYNAVYLNTLITLSYCFAPKLNPAIGCMPWANPSISIKKSIITEFMIP